MIYWFSFSGPAGFRGVVLSSGANLTDALEKINLAKINPGGQIRGYVMHPEDPDHARALSLMSQLRLYTKAELVKLDTAVSTLND